VKLDYNIRQSKAEERVLGRKAMTWISIGPNVQHQVEQRPSWGQRSKEDFNVVRGPGFRP